MLGLLRNQTRVIVDETIGAAQLLSCKRLNRIYADAIHVGLCNNGGSGALLVCCVCSAVSRKATAIEDRRPIPTVWY
jgi:hypothetical protein